MLQRHQAIVASKNYNAPIIPHIVNSIFEGIADGLAENGYAVADQFLSQDEIDGILNLKEFKNGPELFKRAGVGKQQGFQINEAIRGDYIHWINKKSASNSLKIYLDRLTDLMQFLNENLFLSLKDSEVHMTIYPAGAFYRRHLDQFKRDDHRKLSVICYLNNNWKESEGGQLRLYLPEKEINFFPIGGRIICFRSDQIEHEVLPATRFRISLTGWMLDQHADLRIL